MPQVPGSEEEGPGSSPMPIPLSPSHTPLPEQGFLFQLEGRECQPGLETSLLPLEGPGGLQTSALSPDAG